MQNSPMDHGGFEKELSPFRTGDESIFSLKTFIQTTAMIDCRERKRTRKRKRKRHFSWPNTS
jgi:hypothetical protein